MLTIGDEILSGRTRDSNMPHLAAALAARGIALRETRVVPDEEAEIVAALNALRARYTHVFTSGGIGPTHDDITADAVAAAFGVGIGVREDARAILAQNYANPEVDLNPARLRMARIPDGAELIENPVSRAPGFSHRQRARHGRGARGLRGDGGGAPAAADRRAAAPLRDACGWTGPRARSPGRSGSSPRRIPVVTIGSYPFTSGGRFGSNLVARSEDPAAWPRRWRRCGRMAAELAAG